MPKDYKHDAACRIDGCHRDVFGAGLCTAHYQRKRRTGNTARRTYQAEIPCSVEGCGNNAYSRSYCHGHYKRFARHGDPTVRKTLSAKGKTCTITGCESDVRSKNLCVNHYANYIYAKRHGIASDAETFIRQRNQLEEGDEAHA